VGGGGEDDRAWKWFEANFGPRKIRWWAVGLAVPIVGGVVLAAVVQVNAMMLAVSLPSALRALMAVEVGFLLAAPAALLAVAMTYKRRPSPFDGLKRQLFATLASTIMIPAAYLVLCSGALAPGLLFAVLARIFVVIAITYWQEIKQEIRSRVGLAVQAAYFAVEACGLAAVTSSAVMHAAAMIVLVNEIPAAIAAHPLAYSVHHAVLWAVDANRAAVLAAAPYWMSILADPSAMLPLGVISIMLYMCYALYYFTFPMDCGRKTRIRYFPSILVESLEARGHLEGLTLRERMMKSVPVSTADDNCYVIEDGIQSEIERVAVQNAESAQSLSKPEPPPPMFALLEEEAAVVQGRHSIFTDRRYWGGIDGQLAVRIPLEDALSKWAQKGKLKWDFQFFGSDGATAGADPDKGPAGSPGAASVFYGDDDPVGSMREMINNNPDIWNQEDVEFMWDENAAKAGKKPLFSDSEDDEKKGKTGSKNGSSASDFVWDGAPLGDKSGRLVESDDDKDDKSKSGGTRRV